MPIIDSKSSTREWLGRNPRLRVPMVVGTNALILLGLTFLLWNFSLLYLNLPLHEAARQQVGQVSERLQDYLDDRMRVLKQIAQFYTLTESMLSQRQTSDDYLNRFLSEGEFNAIYSNHFLNEREFQKFCSSAMALSPGILSVMLTDTDGIPIWVAPQLSSLGRQDVYWLTTDPRFSSSLAYARQENQPAISDPITIPQHGAGLLAAIPVSQSNQRTGFVVGVMPCQEMLGTLIDPQLLKDFHIQILTKGIQIYPMVKQGEVPVKAKNLWEQAGSSRHFNFNNQSWNISITPLLSSKYSPYNALSLSVVGLGICVSLLSTYLLHRLLWRAVRLQTVAKDQLTRLESTGMSLLETKSQLDLIMNSVDEGVILYDDHLVPVQANAAFLTMFQMTDSSKTMTDGKLHHATMVRLLGRETRYWAMFEALKRDPVRTFTDEIESPASKDGKKRDGRCVLRRAMAVVSPRGELQGMLAILKDVTTIKDIERVKDDFLSSVTHELRSPLASIKGFAETMKRDPAMPVETREEFISIICEESSRLQHLIEELLDLRRLQNQGLLLRIVPYDLKVLVDDVVRGARSVTHAKSISIDVQWNGTENARLLGDVAQISRALRNLVTNAVKYSPPGGTISIQGAAGAQKVSLEVSDQGTGIDEKDLPYIFDQFYRGKSKGHQKGTGLGLAIVKHTIELHGGHLGVSSNVGTGTSFRIELPREFDPPGPVQMKKSTMSGAGPALSRR